MLSAQKQSIASSLFKAADSGFCYQDLDICRPTSGHFGHVIQEYPSTIVIRLLWKKFCPFENTFRLFTPPRPSTSIHSICLRFHVDWEKNDEPGAAWELISAMQNGDAETRVQARAFLAKSRHLTGMDFRQRSRQPDFEKT